MSPRMQVSRRAFLQGAFAATLMVAAGWSGRDQTHDADPAADARSGSRRRRRVPVGLL